MYSMESESEEPGIYIVEDSEIDLGLITSVERNLERYFEIITELLGWHERKMKEHPKKEKPVEKFVPEFPEPEERPEAEQPAEKKKGIVQKIKEKLSGKKQQAEVQPAWNDEEPEFTYSEG